MKNTILPILLFCSSSTVFAEEHAILNFSLIEASTSENELIYKSEVNYSISIELNEESAVVNDKAFKGIFKIRDINGYPNLDIQLFDYNQLNQEVLLANINLNATWGMESEISWWYKAKRYTARLTPKR